MIFFTINEVWRSPCGREFQSISYSVDALSDDNYSLHRKTAMVPQDYELDRREIVRRGRQVQYTKQGGIL